MASTTFVGIDAGGSSTRVRAVVDGVVTFEGRSGPANATSTPATVLERNVAEAAFGCPAPERVAGCFAGLSNPGARRLATRALAACFPAAELRLAPDYVAAALASPSADVSVIAGTGSLCVSMVDGVIDSTGGLGYLLGDRGSGFRYGQLLVEHCLLLPPSELPDALRRALLDVFGSADRSEVVQRIHTDPCPAQLLAGLAPVLAASADEGAPWAAALVDQEAGLLAALVARHIDAYLPRCSITVELAGSVWSSVAIRAAFTRHVGAQVPGRDVVVHLAAEAPVAGAIRLAAMPDADFAVLVAQGRASHGAAHGD
jgi:glucosamine kinase